MKKTIFFSTSLLLALILLNPVSAQPARGQDSALPPAAQNARQVKQQENTQNQGEEQNLQIENTLQGEAGEALQEGELNQEQNRSTEAALLKAKSKNLTIKQGAQFVREKNNDVAVAVHELLIERDYRGGIGEQVKVIAQNQLKTQEEIQNRLTNLEDRPVWKRFFLGQNQNEVDNLQNSLRNKQEELSELQTLLENESLSAEDRLAIEEAYLELQAQQELVKTHLQNILGEFNVAGFFRRLFNRS